MAQNPFDQFDGPTGGTVLRKPQDPSAPLDLDLKRGQIAAQEQAAVNARLEAEAKRLAILKAQAELAAGPQGEASEKRAQKLANLRSLERQIAEVRKLYKAGPGSTSGIAGVLDALPTPGNAAFDSASASMAEIGLGAFRTPGVGSQSDAELRAFVDANRPSASDFDARIEQKLRNLETRLNSTYEELGIKPLNISPPQTNDRDFTPGEVPPAAAPGAPNRTGGFTGGGNAGPTNTTVATGDTATAPDAEASAIVDRMVRQGASAAQINAELQKREGSFLVNQEGVSKAQQWLRTPEGQKYRGSIGNAIRTVPTTTTQWLKGNAIMHPAGTATATYLNAGGVGLPTLLGGEEAQLTLGAARAENPWAAFGGDLAGGFTGTFGTSKALGIGARGLEQLGLGKAASVVSNPLTADLLYSTTFGANTAGEGNRLKGAGIGVGATLGGNTVGKYALAPGIRAFGQTAPGMALGNAGNRAGQYLPEWLGGSSRTAPLSPVPPKLPVAEAMIQNAIGDNGQAIIDTLQEAHNLKLPMTLADTNPALRSLGAAASRRSPDAKGIAEGALIPRSRGQIDRLQAGMDRDFGSGANIPQRSADLIQQARTNAGPLYDAFRASDPVPSQTIDELLATPAGRDALGRARTIAANDMRNPDQLGFVTDEMGNVSLSRTPFPETIDYVKRGLDDSLEPYRNPITRSLDLNGEGGSINGVRSRFIAEADSLYPNYPAARAAYAGPAGEREAFHQGAGALNQSADTIRFSTQNMPGSKMDQYRLGFRSALGDRAEGVRYSSNPYEGVAGSPASQERLDILWPETSPRFLRQYGLEGDMARTNREVLGNSLTAERQLADEQFGISPRAIAAADIGTSLMTGGAPVATILSAAQKGIGDAVKLGIGKQAKAKADALAPILFNTDAGAAAVELAAARRAAKTYNALSAKAKRKARKAGGIFGSTLAIPGIVAANE